MARMVMRRPAVMMVAALVMLMFSQSALAEDSLSGALGKLQWGDSSADVLDTLKDQMKAEFKEKLEETRDTIQRDRMRKKMNERMEKLDKSVVELKDGVKSGLEVSIVSTEFVKNNNESVLKVREDVAIRYYFFLEDRLYKLVIAYDDDYIDGLAYDSFVYAVSQKYGKPKKEIMDEDGFLEASLWEQGDTRLRVKDTFDIYSTHLMVFANTNDEDKVYALHEAKASKRTAGPEIDDDIDNLTYDDGETGEGSAADALLGGDTEVDLTAGLPQEDLDALKQQQLEAEGGAQKTQEEKKKKKKKKKKRRSKKFKEKELKDRQKKLIIY